MDRVKFCGSFVFLFFFPLLLLVPSRDCKIVSLVVHDSCKGTVER